MEPLPGSTRSTVHTRGTSNFDCIPSNCRTGIDKCLNPPHQQLAGDANGLYTKLPADTVLECCRKHKGPKVPLVHRLVPLISNRYRTVQVTGLSLILRITSWNITVQIVPGPTFEGASPFSPTSHSFLHPF